MKIKMTRTAVGEIDGEQVHYMEGRTYDGVSPWVAQKLHAAGACEWAGDSFPKLEQAEADVVEEARAEPVAEVADKPKKRRRTRKKAV